MGRWSNLLEGDCENTKEKNLNSGSRSVPERSRDSVLPGNIGRLEKSSGPSPLRDDDGGSKAGLDGTSCSAEEKLDQQSDVSVLMMIRSGRQRQIP